MRNVYPILLSAMLLPAAAFAQTGEGTPSPAISPAMPGSAAPAMTMSPARPEASLTLQDSSFIRTAALAGMAEVQAGQLAEQNGTPAVQKLGATMVADHSKANAALTTLATQLGVTPPSTLTPHAAAMLKTLQPLHGRSFDTRYLAGQKLAHEKAIALFETESAKGHDPELKRFASETLPTLKSHLRMIETTR